MSIIHTIVQQAQKNEKDDQETIPVPKKFLWGILSAEHDNHKFFKTKMIIAFSASILILGFVTVLYLQAKIESFQAQASLSRAVFTENTIPKNTLEKQNI
ncbi:MAG: hypothetical protein WCJ84_04565 [Candidatus Peregrinibacteria bacterium]